MSGPKLWNALPRNMRNVENCSLEQFKELLDCFLSKVPDEPKTENLTPGATDVMTGKATNSLEFQCGRRTEDRKTQISMVSHHDESLFSKY